MAINMQSVGELYSAVTSEQHVMHSDKEMLLFLDTFRASWRRGLILQPNNGLTYMVI